MSSGWLTPWAIWKAALSKWIIKSDGDLLIPWWEFPNRSGHVVVATSDDPYVNVVEHFEKIRAVALTYIVNAEDLSAALPLTCTLAAQPDVPRTLQFTFSHGANISAFSVTIIGVDAMGVTHTTTYTQAAGWTFWTAIAYARITSIIVTARTGTGVGETLNVGIWSEVGLANKIANAADIYKVVKSLVAGLATEMPAADYTVDATNNTVDLETGGNIIDGDSFTIYYKSRVYSI